METQNVDDPDFYSKAHSPYSSHSIKLTRKNSLATNLLESKSFNAVQKQALMQKVSDVEPNMRPSP